MLPEHLLLVGMLADPRARDHDAAASATASRSHSSRSPPRPVRPLARRRRVRRARLSRAITRRAVGSSLPKAVLLALALPVLLISRDDFAETRYYVLRAGVAVRRLPARLLRQLPDAVPRHRDHVAAGVRAGAARLPAPREQRGGAQVPRARRCGDRDAADGRLVALRLGRVARPRRCSARRSARPTRSPPRAPRSSSPRCILKAAIVPLHAWAPDAYEGASVPVTAYMATVIKAAVLLAALRLFATAPVVAADGGAARGAAARLDGLGQPRGHPADEFPPHDRVLVDRARRLPVLRVPGRRRRAATRRSCSTWSPMA